MNTGQPLAEGHLLDGRYRVKKILGVGGMGRVYLANDTRLASRPVAVKEMVIGDGIAEKKAIEDFTREATVLARLTHPGIPTLIDHFAELGRQYLVMEFVAGGDLDRMLEQAGPAGRIAEPRVVRWSRQILAVLEFLHAQTPPIIYRDLKPGNVMVDKDGRAMLVDFGIARFLPKGGHATQIGSPGYAPPEQYAGKVDARSDLYALAATMHHLLTGRDPRVQPPFSFPPVRQLAPEVSERTAAAIDRALSHSPEQRFAGAREMLDALPEPSDEEFAQAGPALVPTAELAGPSGAQAPSVQSSSPTPPSLQPAPRLSGRQPASGLAQAPTVVLKNPVRQGAAPSGPSRVAPQIQKAIELTGKARELIERGLKSKFVEAILPPLSADNATSPTAKTQELKLPASSSKASAAPSRTNSRAPSPTSAKSKSRASSRAAPALFSDRDGSSAAVGAPARLVARGERHEFALDHARTIIGRSEVPADEPDIDLAGLKRGAERVSRRHAEIVRRGGDYYIRDLGSLNGTFIAGRGRIGRDQLYKLKDRDQIVLGGAILQFRRG
jgi:serine/threonine protein kinase